jgi:hypothetical protein
MENKPKSWRGVTKAAVGIWVVISAIWVVFVLLFLKSPGTEVNHQILAIYFIIGPLVTAGALWFLHSPGQDIFASIHTWAPIGAVCLAIFGLFGYLITAQREARGPFLDRQLDSCAEIADTAAKLAFLPNGKRRDDAWDKFWAYHWGRLGMFENPLLAKVMQEFVDLMWGQGGDLHEPALCVAHICRLEVQASWAVVPGLIRPTQLQNDPHCNALDKAFKSFCLKNQNHPECSSDGPSAAPRS